MRSVIKRQTTIVGRLHSDVSRKMTALIQAVQEALGHSVAKAVRLIAQTRSHKAKVNAKDKQPELYSWCAPKVECLSKVKSRRPYEFGVKVGIATALKGTLIVGARAFTGNPYDGHTLNKQVEQASILVQAAGLTPETVYVDLAYRVIDIKHRGTFKSMTEQEKTMLKPRQALEPIMGHLKANHRMNRCHLKGRRRRQSARGAVRCGRQHRLVAANDHQERGGPFLAAVSGSGFDPFNQFAAKVTAKLDCQTD